MTCPMHWCVTGTNTRDVTIQYLSTWYTVVFCLVSSRLGRHWGFSPRPVRFSGISRSNWQENLVDHGHDAVRRLNYLQNGGRVAVAIRHHPVAIKHDVLTVQRGHRSHQLSITRAIRYHVIVQEGGKQTRFREQSLDGGVQDVGQVLKGIVVWGEEHDGLVPWSTQNAGVVDVGCLKANDEAYQIVPAG